MKPNFALDLSHEGIVLLHRTPRNKWTVVGDVKIDDSELRETLAFLRTKAIDLDGKGFGTKLIIPDSQILFLEVAAPGPGENERRGQIMAALEGRTPYDVGDLAFDWFGHGATVQVAVVANETLDEAEEFAVEHRFNPVSFAARGDWHGEEWEPFFGRTDFSYAFLGAEAQLRETPVGGVGAPETVNLFVEPDEALPPLVEDPEASADTDGESIFVADDETGASKNIFVESEGDIAPAAKADATSEPVAPAPNAPATPVPAFSTRRPATADADPVPDSERPIARVAPRIAIAAADEPRGKPTPVVAAPAAQGGRDDLPPIVPASDFRAGIFDDEATRKSSLTVRVNALVTGLLARLRRPKPDDAPLLAEFAADPETGAEDKPAVSPADADPTQVDETGSEALPEVSRRGRIISLRGVMDRIKRPARTETDADAPSTDRASDADAALSRMPQAIAAQEFVSRNRRRITLGALAGGLLLLVGLGAYSLMPGGDRLTGDGTDFTNVSLEERGVTAENRPRRRPEDLNVAALEQDILVPPIRPERRSLFEGGSDPIADLPDTARPARDLTEQELADIRAAGLPVPTTEELDEGAEADGADSANDAELQAAYEETGALQGVRIPSEPDADAERDDIYVAAIDRPLEANDAIILPNFNRGPDDDQPKKRMSPLPADLVFDLDARGLVKPEKDGALNPEGILVFAGKPTVTPPTKPVTEELVPPDPHAALKPKARPAELKTGADAIFIQGRLTLAELQSRKPKSRPESEQQAAAAEASAVAAATNTTAISQLAVLTSTQPSHRPSDFAKTVESTTVTLASATPADELEPTYAPSLPTKASVAKQATIKNAMNLSELNLIGVYGTPNNRRALLRLPSGRFVKVEPGDRVDGGQIAGIDIDSIRYVKGGRNRVLKIPD